MPGVLRHFPDESTLIPQISAEQIDQIAREHAQGRMRIKLLGAQEALAQGVARVVLGDARSAHPILHALDGQGTVITQQAAQVTP